MAKNINLPNGDTALVVAVLDADGNLVLDSEGNPVLKTVISQALNIFTSGIHVTGHSTDAAAQLWNPAASGVNLKVAFVSIKMASSGLLNVWKGDAALATDSSANSGNLNFDGSAPNGEYRTTKDLALSGDVIGAAYGLANNTVPLWELVGTTVTPGTGLTLDCTNAGAFLGVFQWTEETI